MTFKTTKPVSGNLDKIICSSFFKNVLVVNYENQREHKLDRKITEIIGEKQHLTIEVKEGRLTSPNFPGEDMTDNCF